MKKKILVAEDDQAIADVVKIILDGEGYETDVVSVETVFLHKALNEAPDLILLDIWLDGSDGSKLAKTLRQDKRTAHIPIIIVSANNETQAIAKAVGANDFLQKPFSYNDLVEKAKLYTTQ